MSFERLIATRYLWSKRPEAFITIITYISILGVAIGVLVLTTVMAVMTGFEHELRNKIVEADSHIVIRNISGKIPAWKELEKKISDFSEVNAVSPFTYNQGLIRSEGHATGVIVKGIAKSSESARRLASTIQSSFKIEDLFERQNFRVLSENSTEENLEADLPSLIIGSELAKSNGILPSSPVSLVSPEAGSTPFGLVPRFRRFLTVGLFDGLIEYERGLVYVNLEEAQRFFRMGDAVSGLEIWLRNAYAAPLVTKKIMELLPDLAPGSYAEDWTQTNKPLWDALNLEKKVYFIVLLLIIVMASFSIISTLIMIVLEKRKDIAVLRTFGASASSIRKIFQIQGTIIGGAGTVLGLIGGWATCLMLKHYGFPLDDRIFPMSELPIRMEPINFLIVGISSFFICFIATIYPAKRASELYPSEVLRH